LGACSRATSGGGGSSERVLAVGSGDLVLVAGGGINRPAESFLLICQFKRLASPICHRQQ